MQARTTNARALIDTAPAGTTGHQAPGPGASSGGTKCRGHLTEAAEMFGDSRHGGGCTSRPGETPASGVRCGNHASLRRIRSSRLRHMPGRAAEGIPAPRVSPSRRPPASRPMRIVWLAASLMTLRAVARALARGDARRCQTALSGRTSTQECQMALSLRTSTERARPFVEITSLRVPMRRVGIAGLPHAACDRELSPPPSLSTASDRPGPSVLNEPGDAARYPSAR